MLHLGVTNAFIGGKSDLVVLLNCLQGRFLGFWVGKCTTTMIPSGS